jgi:hypothetical protein
MSQTPTISTIDDLDTLVNQWYDKNKEITDKQQKAKPDQLNLSNLKSDLALINDKINASAVDKFELQKKIQDFEGKLNTLRQNNNKDQQQIIDQDKLQAILHLYEGLLQKQPPVTTGQNSKNIAMADAFNIVKKSPDALKIVGQVLWGLMQQLWSVIATLFKDPKEIFLFVVTLSMITLIIVLFYYSSIQKEVNKNSRCIREKRSGQVGGTYVVEARNEYNDPLYKVAYNLSAKKYDLSCSCKPGDVVNHFTDIKVYDMRNPKNPVRKIPDQMCSCDRMVEPVTTYYDGYPDLLRFMNSNDTSFFTAVPGP